MTVPATTNVKKAKWTVMVYLAGDNNLTDECIFAMTEMKKVGSDDDLKIITQFDPRDEYLPTHRYHIGQNGNSASLSEDILSTAEDGKFVSTDKFKKLPGESARAKSHDGVRSGAHRAGKKAIRAEARRLAQEEAKARAAARAKAKAKAKVRGKQNVARAVATQETVPAREPVILGVEEEVGLGQNDTDTGSPITLYNFMSLCVEQFPAEHYMVVLAGHASGTARDFLLKDDSPVGSLTINELKRAFEELKSELEPTGQVIDILGMDVCLMSMAEVAYELKGLVKIMVGSESYSPASGWPYAPILGRLKTRIAELNPEAEEILSPKKRVEYEFAKDIVKEYVNFYSDYFLSGLSVDQSAMDVGLVETLKSHIDRFADAMRQALGAKDNERFKDALLLAHWEAQSYNGEQFVDIFDFCDCLLRRYPEGAVAETGKTLMNFISNNFVLLSCYSGALYQYSYGVSIYFPWSKVDREYMNLDFTKGKGETGWLEFLLNYVKLTRRKPRNVDEGNEFGSLNDRQPQRFRATEGKGPGNLVRSMRNPPIVFVPNGCLKADVKENVIEGTEMLFRQKA